MPGDSTVAAQITAVSAVIVAAITTLGVIVAAIVQRTPFSPHRDDDLTEDADITVEAVVAAFSARLQEADELRRRAELERDYWRTQYVLRFGGLK